MKNYIKKLLREGLLEAAFGGNDESLNNSGLFITTDYLVLYDFVEDKIMGVAGVYDLGPIFHLAIVASEDGYGPLMYELSMTHAYPKGVTTDRDSSTSKAAFNVFEKMYNREDVKKESLPTNDENYVDYKDEYVNQILNSVYYFEDRQTYDYLAGKAKQYLDTIENPQGLIKNLNSRSFKFFSNKLN
jgi:hypothetical protein